MPHGHRAIEKLRVGDMALAENLKTGKVEAEPVVAVIVRPVSPLVALDLSDGSHIRVQPNHVFWVDGGHGLHRARRFVCRVRWRRIFCERLPALVAPCGRRTLRQRAALERTGFALGGAPGAHHAMAAGMPVSRRTLLRLVRAAPGPQAGPVRVWGVDDWANRRGRTYGTILVNLETHAVIDLLPDRTAETLATWLRQHPEVEIVSRDRGGPTPRAHGTGRPKQRRSLTGFTS